MMFNLITENEYEMYHNRAIQDNIPDSKLCTFYGGYVAGLETKRQNRRAK